MAAGRFIFFDRWLSYTLSGDFDFMANTIVAQPLHHGYTPGTHSHSAYHQIVDQRSTASGSPVASITLTGKELSFSGSTGTLKMIAADLSGFSQGGDTFTCKYVALYVGGSASSGGVDQPLIGFFDTNTGNTTGVEGTQLNVTWASGGIAKFNINP